MDFPQLTTELEAVNAILASVGESPIVSLDTTFLDAELARDLLRQTLRSTQTKGWHFNTEINWELGPDNQGRIFAPPNLLRYEFDTPALTVRGTRVYDLENHTYTFTSPVTMLSAVMLLSFDECPEALRRFAYVSAGRRFQDRFQGGEVLHQFQARDETAAWAALWDYEASVQKYNMLRQSSVVARIKQNR